MGNKRGRPRVADWIIRRALGLVRAGASRETVADHFGIDRKTIYRWERRRPCAAP